VAAAGYAAFLIGPPVLGSLGQVVGIRDALTVVLLVALVTLFFAGAARDRREPAVALLDR
jgi:hypothetical protein